ncbi:hypothetical protein V6N11_065281 [Hibiscus sabdariffa]|uniref:Uncharacterized protein n=1 Tax=Hibiscus sabdariffa TaxID=183260 RepID=A0ABR2QH16_9ROSI
MIECRGGYYIKEGVRGMPLREESQWLKSQLAKGYMPSLEVMKNKIVWSYCGGDDLAQVLTEDMEDVRKEVAMEVDHNDALEVSNKPTVIDATFVTPSGVSRRLLWIPSDSGPSRFSVGNGMHFVLL